MRSVVHLPLNHLYERANTPQGMLVKGIVPHFGDEVGAFPRNALRGRAAAPRVGAAILVEARLTRHRGNREFQCLETRARTALAMKVGQAYRRRRWNGDSSGCARRALPLARFVVFDRMLKKLGFIVYGMALSSGAPLPERSAGTLADLGR